MRLTSCGVYTRPAPVPKMPAGLVELMDGMARDVLLNNPTDVYAFCTDHMQKLLEIRDRPSRKKPLTLEQKILKAQEKVRQRAKERREKFDKEIQTQTSNEARTLEIADSPLIEGDSVIPNLKTPVQYVHDLQHAPEVEISQDPPESLPLSQLSDVSGPSKVDELNTIVEEVSQETAKDVEKIIETLTEEKLQDSKLSENSESIPNMKYENEVLSEEIVPDQKAEDGTISMLVSLPEKKPSDEDIFGKVELEEMSIEPSKDSKTIDIVEIETTAESQLQTITEASDESSVSEGSAMLPKITIRDEHNVDIKSNADESVAEVVLDVEDRLIDKNSVEKSADQEILTNNSESDVNTSSDKVSENDPILHNNSVTELHNMEHETANIIEKENKGDSNLPEHFNDEKLDNYSEIVTVSEMRSSPDSGYIEVKDLHEGDVEEAKNSDNNAIASAITINSDDNPNIVTQIQNKNMSNVTETEELLNNELTLDRATNEKQAILTKAEDVAVNETNSEIEAETEIKIEDRNINIVEPILQQIVQETDELKHEVKTNDEQNIVNEYKELHGNGTDILIPKSDSIENTNEDSLSIIESDVSKTDEDSQNNPNMDLETAAVTIQKVFRSFMFKSRNSTFEDTANDDRNSLDDENDKKEEYYAAANLNKERRPLGITRMDTVLQTVNEEKSLSLSTDDSSTLSSAATTIQAHVRGFLVRNRLNSSKTFSTNSLVNSHEALETDSDQLKNKTVLNIHIVPEEGNYLSRDESLITSMDLSLDGSPPSSVNLHPLSCDIAERRKMLKREDAVQSVSPPSNNSGKLSEDSVKEILINENANVLERESTDDKTPEIEDQSKDVDNEDTDIVSSASTVTPTTIITISKSENPNKITREISDAELQRNGKSFTKMGSDESDVITPLVPSPRSSEEATTLVHSGEFHDVVLPTKITRNDTSVVSGE